MTFGELCSINKAWQRGDMLEIMSVDCIIPDNMLYQSAKVIFRDRKVIWFQDTIIMLGD